MARNSRKKFGRITNEGIEQQKKYQVGIYARLSVKGDERKEESIDNQIAICKEYIDNNPDMMWIDSYIDLGKSGMNFHRKGFEKMIAEVKEGRINCIIVKDLSRIGRNHLETGYYVEKVLPQYHIRVLAVNDSFDSFQRGENEELFSLKNLVNEMYARDISRKVASVKQQQWKKGEYTGGIPPYGYQIVKNEVGRKLEIEEETAEVVRDIYEWYLEGIAIKDIIKILYRKKINPPREYRKTGKVKEINIYDVKFWSVTGIKHILTNPVYLGCMVKAKKQEGAYKIYSNMEWETFQDFIQKNTHPPIICKEKFYEIAEKSGKKYCYRI